MKIRNDEPDPHLYFQKNSDHLKASTDFALLIPLSRLRQSQEGVSIVVRIWPPPRSWQVSCHTKSVTSKRQTWDTSWLTLNPEERASGFPPTSHSILRREPQALPWAHIEPRREDLEPFLFPTSATTRSLPDLHDIGSSQRLPLPMYKLSSKVYRIVKVVTLPLYLHVLNTFLFQWRQLWIVADIWACQCDGDISPGLRFYTRMRRRTLSVWFD